MEYVRNIFHSPLVWGRPPIAPKRLYVSASSALGEFKFDFTGG